MNVRIEPYRRIVVRPRPDAKSVMYLRYWGAVGDYLYFLTFLRPFLRKKKDFKRVLAADVYPRYSGNPLLELCRATDLIDELWVHPRKGGGPTSYPQEFIQQAEHPQPNVELYKAGIYYEFLKGPGVLEFPVGELRAEEYRVPRSIIITQDWERVKAHFPSLPEEFITLQPFTFGKQKNNKMSIEFIRALTFLKVPLVVLEFPTDRKQGLDDRELGKIPGVLMIPVSGVVDSLNIQSYAMLHVGIESSQLMSAAIMGIHVCYFPYWPGSLGHFEHDLGIGQFCHPLDWKAPSVDSVDVVRSALCGSPFN